MPIPLAGWLDAVIEQYRPAMRWCLASLVLLVLGGVATGQAAQAIPCGDVFEAFAKRGDAGSVPAPDRLVRLIKTQITAAALAERLARKPGDAAPGPKPPVVVTLASGALIVTGTKELTATITAMVEQLRRADRADMRLQFTLVTLPADAAAIQGLQVGMPSPADEAAVGKLMKEAAKGQGTIENFPETKALPLTPFVAESARARRVPPGGAAGDQELRVGGEGVLVAPDEAVIALKVSRGPLPEDRLELSPGHVLRLKVGDGVLLMTSRDRTATLLWARLVAIALPSTAGDPGAKSPGR